MSDYKNLTSKFVADIVEMTMNNFKEYIENKVDDTNVKELIDEYTRMILKENVQEKPKKVKRPPSKYNLYIKKKIAEIKETTPEVYGKDLMKLAVESYRQDIAKKG